MEDKKDKISIVGFGEVLWDIFPEAETLGGAPANFCSHCSALGAKSTLISAVGDDSYGRRALEQLNKTDVGLQFVPTLNGYSTGKALISYLNDGTHQFNIVENSAWDNITIDSNSINFCSSIDAFCYGTLSQRNKTTRNSLNKFLNSLPKSVLKVFDINLRQNYYSDKIIESSINKADFLKINEDEFPIVCNLYNINGNQKESLYKLLDICNLKYIALTLGKKGSILLSKDKYSQEPIIDGPVVDTVGAGDSFTASLIMGILNGLSLKEANKHGAKVATYVCSQRGAVPIMPKNLIF